MVRLALPGNRQICTQHEIENTPCILTASRCINLSRQCQVSGQCQVRIDSEVFMSTGTEFMSQCTASNLAEPVPRTCASPKLCPTLISTGCDVAFHNRDAISPSHDGHDWTLSGLDPSTASLSSHASTGKLGSSPAARGTETKTSKA